MYVLVCPGIHNLQATQEFLQGLQRVMGQETSKWLVFPTDRYPAYSAVHLGWFLSDQLRVMHPQNWLNQPVVMVGFSAGVVGAIAAAWGWRLMGGTIAALIAVDGWGVPLVGDFPIYRLSHDYFTHWSSALLGAGQESFYAEPAVEHLTLWRSPETTQGWRVSSTFQPPSQPITAAEFIATLLSRYNATSYSGLVAMNTSSMTIQVEREPNQERLNGLGVSRWPIWTKEASEFPWHYDEQETCYLLEGDVLVTPVGGDPVRIGRGDLVTFPAGLSCTWKIVTDVRKHYTFG